MNTSNNPWPEGKAIAVIMPLDLDRGIYGEYRQHILLRSRSEFLDQKSLARFCGLGDLNDIEKVADAISFGLYRRRDYRFVQVVSYMKHPNCKTLPNGDTPWLWPSLGDKNRWGDVVVSGMLDYISWTKWMYLLGHDQSPQYRYIVGSYTIYKGVVHTGTTESLRVAQLIPKKYPMRDRVLDVVNLAISNGVRA